MAHLQFLRLYYFFFWLSAKSDKWAGIYFSTVSCVPMNTHAHNCPTFHFANSLQTFSYSVSIGYSFAASTTFLASDKRTQFYYVSFPLDCHSPTTHVSLVRGGWEYILVIFFILPSHSDIQSSFFDARGNSVERQRERLTFPIAVLTLFSPENMRTYCSLFAAFYFKTKILSRFLILNSMNILCHYRTCFWFSRILHIFVVFENCEFFWRSEPLRRRMKVLCIKVDCISIRTSEPLSEQCFPQICC